jgi:uncharacterized Tic20 family protein
MNQTNTFLGTEEPVTVTPSSDDKTMAILSHCLCIVAGFVAPLVIYLIKKDNSPYATAHAKESLNFQLTMLIAYFASFILMFILIGIPLLVLLSIANLVLVIIATIRASENKMYRYPFSIKFIK